MSHLRIRGSARLSGAVDVQGAKNAALPIMAAAILASEPVTLRGAPRLTDVETLAELLASLGVSVRRGRDGSLRIATLDPLPVAAPRGLVRRMRASVCVLGPLVARRGAAIVPLPGGCDLGPRPIDLHLAGLAALGADVRIERGAAVVAARRLRGASIELAGPRGSTVTGTANVLSAATLARGVTVIRQAAREPEIVDLAQFLRRLGADIEGEGSDTIVIRGVEELGGGEHAIIPDRIEAGSLLIAAAITGSRVTARGARAEHLSAVLETLALSGQRIDVGPGAITLAGAEIPRSADVIASAYPGFPSDLQAPLAALLSLAPGRSSITDRVFPERWGHLPELRALGAEINRRHCRATTRGVAALVGTTVRARDLRGASALVLAGLAAQGTTIVRGLGRLDRGYECWDAKLRALGADVERVEGVRRLPAGTEANARPARANPNLLADEGPVPFCFEDCATAAIL